jgi:outer membrane protein OmpA-like peptidoglycan-associated protein
MSKVTISLLAVVFLLQSGFSQNIDGRWTIGPRGGANFWFNTLSDQKVGPGAELEIGYGLSQSLGLSFLTGWELVKSEQTPTTAELPNSYLKFDGVPASLALKWYFSPGEAFAPYGYLGAGGMFYKRRTNNNVYVPEDKWETSIHIPIGLGFNAFATKDIAFTVDLSYRFMDAWTDYAGTDGTPDGYATAKAGLNFFLGSSDSDDDDMDGLTNGEEKKLGTNPENADTDGDGLKDGEEVNTTMTDPLKADTDGDGLNDGAEVRTHKTDPRKADTDGDGLNDGDEVMKHKTDPLKADTDGDGLSDGAEVSINLTNPTKADSDGDTLSDGDEVNRYKTNPLIADTDAGSVDDGREVTRGTDPMNPEDDVPVKVGQVIILEGVTFKTGSAEITGTSEDILAKALKGLLDYPEVEVEIAGHTDNTGSRATNMKLSEQRAESVKNWLTGRGVEPKRISTSAHGPDKPIAPNTTKEGRDKNRRIEFIRTK